MPHSQIKLKSLAKCFISEEIFGPLFHSCQREAFLIIAMSNLLHASLHCHPLHMRNRVENRILNSVFLKIFCCTLRTPSTHTLFFLVYRMDFCAVHRMYRLSKTRVLKKTKAVCQTQLYVCKLPSRRDSFISTSECRISDGWQKQASTILVQLHTQV